LFRTKILNLAKLADQEMLLNNTGDKQ